MKFNFILLYYNIKIDPFIIFFSNECRNRKANWKKELRHKKIDAKKIENN